MIRNKFGAWILGGLTAISGLPSGLAGNTNISKKVLISSTADIKNIKQLKTKKH